MLKIGSVKGVGGSRWHVLLAHRPSEWFVGDGTWPGVGRPVMQCRGFGPLQLRRFIPFDEAEGFQSSDNPAVAKAQ